MDTVTLAAHPEINNALNHIIRNEQMPLHIHSLNRISRNYRRIRRKCHSSFAFFTKLLQALPITLNLTNKIPRLIEPANHFWRYILTIK